MALNSTTTGDGEKGIFTMPTRFHFYLRSNMTPSPADRSEIEAELCADTKKLGELGLRIGALHQEFRSLFHYCANIELPYPMYPYALASYARCGGESVQIAPFYSDIEECRAKLTRLDMELAHLCEQQSTHEHRIRGYKRILHPLRYTPADILSAIFLYFVKEDLEDESAAEILSAEIDDPRGRGTLWILPHVSTEWRTIALSFTRLWSTIRISPYEFTFWGKKLSSTLFRLQLQLERSKDHPLAVSICSNQAPIPNNNPLIAAVFKTVERWEELSLWIPLESYKKLPPISSLPPLRALHIWFPPTYTFNINLTTYTIPLLSLLKKFESCPRLEQIYTFPLYLGTMHLPFDQIREFYCPAEARLSDCLIGLHMLPNLRVCLIWCCSDADWDEHDSKKVRLDHLEKLEMESTHRIPNLAHGAIELLKFLDAPGLQFLSLKKLREVDNLLIFLEQSKCRLKHLELESEVLNGKDCTRVLEKTPSLTTLAFDIPRPYADLLVGKLIDSESLLPSLTFLHLSVKIDCDMQQLEKLKKARPKLAFNGREIAWR